MSVTLLLVPNGDHGGFRFGKHTHIGVEVFGIRKISAEDPDPVDPYGNLLAFWIRIWIYTSEVRIRSWFLNYYKRFNKISVISIIIFERI